MRVQLNWHDHLNGYRCGKVTEQDHFREQRQRGDLKIRVVEILKPVTTRSDSRYSSKKVISRENLPAAIAILRFNGIEVEVEK